ncbi:hypothetical protein OESDEN_02755 [Oesophagostomum dentatum]|uniref:Nematode fatty acid retinoid binding protein n=1 Tax=Oesophagostomum dentatum TaxID=61180 RepID=A0A0B1TPF1_OESDE|nr:hypothetical protein OESDEN_02755 [Oesophagostomum dentatum]
MSRYKIVVAVLVMLAIAKTSAEVLSYYEVYKKIDYISKLYYNMLSFLKLFLSRSLSLFCHSLLPV